MVKRPRPPGIKSNIMTKMVDSVLLIDIFEQQCVWLKVMLQSPRLNDHIHSIGIYQYLSNNALFEQKYLQNIKKLYKYAIKRDNQQQSKIFLRLIWFLLLKDSPMTVPYLP